MASPLRLAGAFQLRGLCLRKALSRDCLLGKNQKRRRRIRMRFPALARRRCPNISYLFGS
jgi:hypothetical protein